MSKRTRIAILADFPLSALEGEFTGRGGGKFCTWLPQLALGLQNQKDLDIHWVIRDREVRKPAAAVEALGQHFHRVPALPMSVDLLTGNFVAKRTLRKAIRQIQPDIVHAWGTERIYPCALEGCEVPTILSMQGVLTELNRVAGADLGWRFRKIAASEPGFIQSATVVTCESEWGIKKLKLVAPDADCRQIEYGVHPSFYEIEWNPDPAEPFALYVGSIAYHKGTDVLFDALALDADRGWECRIAGGQNLEELIQEKQLVNVRSLGVLPWDKLQEQLAKAWCLVLPTRADTSPNVVKEARVVGLPVVTTPDGGQSGYILDGQNGRIVSPLEAEGLRDAMADVMSSYSRAKEMGASRLEEDRKYLHPENTAVAFAKLYREMAAQKSV